MHRAAKEATLVIRKELKEVTSRLTEAGKITNERGRLVATANKVYAEAKAELSKANRAFQSIPGISDAERSWALSAVGRQVPAPENE